jgi:hypothetical protein
VWIRRVQALRSHRICAAARERFGNEAVGRLCEAYGRRYWYEPTADDDAWDALIRAESDEAFRRTGEDVGTPIITYDPPHGSELKRSDRAGLDLPLFAG